MIRSEYAIWDGDNIVYTEKYYKNKESTQLEYTQDYYVRGIDLVSKINLSEENNEHYYYIQNGHGDVARMMDTSGNILNSYTYDPYGVVMSQTEGTYNPFKYAGELQDMSSGLIYLRNRYYDPSIGRFITEDPIRSGTNWYVYANNNPVNYIDPLGLDAIVANQSKNVWGAEHMSAFVQDDNGNWHFFYWGMSDVSLTKVDDATILEKPEKINEWLEKNKLSDGKYKYDEFCYIEGDFSETKDYYKELADQYDTDIKNNKIGWFEIKNRKYNLITRNCSQETMKGLYKGKIGEKGEQTVKQKHNKSGYTIAILPLANLDNLQRVFKNKTFTKER